MACSPGAAADSGRDAAQDAPEPDSLDTPPDRSAIPDTPLDRPPADVAPASLPGRWRLIGWSSTVGGAVLTLGATDRLVSYAGRAAQARVNGTLVLEPGHLARTWAFLLDGHVAITRTAQSASDAMAITVSMLPGTLGAQTFTPIGSPDVVFDTNADGTISESLDTPTFGTARLTWTRDDRPVALASLTAQTLVVTLRPDLAAPFAHPRAALAWDLPGMSTGMVLTNDSALTFVSSGEAGYNLVLSNVPPNVSRTLGSTSVALANVIVYDDLDANGQYDPPVSSSLDAGTVDAVPPPDGAPVTDLLRGVSRVQITARSFAPPGSDLLDSAFQYVAPGFQLGTLGLDGTRPRIGPFDGTHPVPSDTAVEIVVSPVPDLP